MNMYRRLALLGTLLVLGCSDSMSTLPSAVYGVWTHDFGFPGSSLNFTLSTQGNAIAGHGTWTGEACCAGTVTISGSVAADVVTLDLDFTSTSGGNVPPYTEHFEGRLVAPNLVSGVMTSGGQSTAYTYRRFYLPD